MKNHCYSVIIAGGKGTRFWPLSRARRPKQLLRLFGSKSLIRETFDRVRPFSGQHQTLVVTVAEQLNPLLKELRGVPRGNFLAEPQGQNTGPCIALAALEVTLRDPTAVMIILPADHWVADAGEFRRTLNAAVQLAGRTSLLITIGIPPEYPETGYGYIMKDKLFDGNKPTKIFRVKRFKEKPILAIARRLIRQGALWNSGIFVWKASTVLELLRVYRPDIYQPLERIKLAARGKTLAQPGPQLRAAMAREYRKMPNISIDHGVLEQAGSAGRVLTLEGNFGWSDVGSWAAVHRMMRRDSEGNAGSGRWLGFDAKNCFVHSSNRLVALLGVADLVVVDTPDALLVGDLQRSQEVRDLVEGLKRRGYGAYTDK